MNITIFTIFTFHSMFSMFWSNSNKLIFSVLKVLRLGFVIETCSKTSELFLICPFLRENLSTSSCILFLFTETWFLGDLRLGSEIGVRDRDLFQNLGTLFNLSFSPRKSFHIQLYSVLVHGDLVSRRSPLRYSFKLKRKTTNCTKKYSIFIQS